MREVRLSLFCVCISLLSLMGCVKSDVKFQVLLSEMSSEPLYIGKNFDIKAIRDKCTHLEKENDKVYCYKEAEKIDIALTISNGVIESIYVREVDDYESPPEFLTAIAKENKLDELVGFPIKGAGDYYRVGGDEVQITHDSDYTYGVRYYHFFVALAQTNEKEDLITRHDEVYSKIEYTTLFSFKLSDDLTGRNPIGYKCRRSYIVDLTLCTNKVFLDYLNSYNENIDNSWPNIKEPHGILLDGLEVVALHYTYGEYISVHLDNLFEQFGGKVKFTQTSDKEAVDEYIGVDEYYTVNERGDLIVIKKFGVLNTLDIHLYASDSVMKRNYIEYQDASFDGY